MRIKLGRAAKGAAVPHNKATASLATEVMPTPEKIVLLMSQHIGAPCKPVVQKGDTVKVGQLVGKAPSPVSADIHSGVSGTVSGIEQLVSTNGALVETVVITTDGEQTLDETLAPPAVKDRESFLEAVRACGLVGLGGAGFPTAIKMAPKNPDAIDTLIINAAECEPYITADTREMMEASDSVLTGIEATLKYLNIPRAIIGIERNKPEAIDLMFTLTKGNAKLQVMPLDSRYPQGAEKVLIENTTRREVPAGKLPADVGVLVLNVTTVSALGKYLQTGMPLTKKRVTVDGGAVAEPKNVEVIIGTPLIDVINFCGGFKEPAAKVIMGGPMMGVAMSGTDYPVIKNTNAIICLTAKEAYLPEPEPCIRCGRCVEGCPVGLTPTDIADAYDAGDRDALKALSVEICMSCGTCSFVCPAKRRVSQNCSLARLFYLKGAKK